MILHLVLTISTGFFRFFYYFPLPILPILFHKATKKAPRVISMPILKRGFVFFWCILWLSSAFPLRYSYATFRTSLHTFCVFHVLCCTLSRTLSDSINVFVQIHSATEKSVGYTLFRPNYTASTFPLIVKKRMSE